MTTLTIDIKHADILRSFGNLEEIVEKALYDYDQELLRAVIKLEGIWKNYQIIVSEVHRADGTTRYAYYIFTHDNQLIHGFDNSGDRTAVKPRYGPDGKPHQHEEIPHQHDPKGNVTLTPGPMRFETFIEWLLDNLAD